MSMFQKLLKFSLVRHYLNVNYQDYQILFMLTFLAMYQNRTVTLVARCILY